MTADPSIETRLFRWYPTRFRWFAQSIGIFDPLITAFRQVSMSEAPFILDAMIASDYVTDGMPSGLLCTMTASITEVTKITISSYYTASAIV